MVVATFVIFFAIALTAVNSQTAYPCNNTAPCGCSFAPAVMNRILGGETAFNNTWGWSVSVLFNESYFCGGSIISSSWIITVASCAYGFRPWEIYVSAATNELLGSRQWRYASQIVMHPNFDVNTWANDIALIQVDPPFDMTDRSIARICLPNPTTLDYPPLNTSLIAVGWGITNQSNDASFDLQQVTLQRLASTNTRCSRLLVNRSSQFCASVTNGTKGICPGDDGGPLMMFTSTRQWVLTGIVSDGFYCYPTTSPSVYTRMTYFVDWIRSMNITDMFTIDMVTVINTTSVTTNNVATTNATSRPAITFDTNPSTSSVNVSFTSMIVGVASSRITNNINTSGPSTVPPSPMNVNTATSNRPTATSTSSTTNLNAMMSQRSSVGDTTGVMLTASTSSRLSNGTLATAVTDVMNNTSYLPALNATLSTTSTKGSTASFHRSHRLVLLLFITKYF